MVVNRQVMCLSLLQQPQMEFTKAVSKFSRDVEKLVVEIIRLQKKENVKNIAIVFRLRVIDVMNPERTAVS